MKTNYFVLCCAFLVGCGLNTPAPSGKLAIKVSSTDYRGSVLLKDFPTPGLLLGDVYLWNVNDPDAGLEFAGNIGETVQAVMPNEPAGTVNASISDQGAAVDGANTNVGKIMIDSYRIKRTELLQQNGGKEPPALPFLLSKAKTDLSAYRYVIISGFESNPNYKESPSGNGGIGAFETPDVTVQNKDNFNAILDDHIQYNCQNGGGSTAHCAFVLNIYEPSLNANSEGTFFGLEPTVRIRGSSLSIAFEKILGK